MQALTPINNASGRDRRLSVTQLQEHPAARPGSMALNVWTEQGTKLTRWRTLLRRRVACFSWLISSRRTGLLLLATLLTVLVLRVRLTGEKAYIPDVSTSARGCKVPKLRPDEPSVAHFFKQLEPLRCSQEPNWVIVLNQKLQISEAAKTRHGAVKCTYRPINRVDDDSNRYGSVHSFTESVALVASDFSEVNCTAADGATYHNHYAVVLPRPASNNGTPAQLPPSSAEPLNVYMLCLDSISHMSFQRKLAKTYAFLSQRLAATVLDAYNIVGDGTPQALIPILTGSTEPELPNTKRRFKHAQRMDVYPFIWKDFKAAGYVTQYGEDTAGVSTFNYRMTGFAEPPTDHYMRPFSVATEDAHGDCFGNDTQARVFLRYAESFFDAYPRRPKFSFMHYNRLTHDNMNTPALIDADLEAHLRRLHERGHLQHTLLVVFADHGHRFAALRATQQGQLEERLPFFSIVAPESFRNGAGRHHWRNLQANVHRLSTPFDIHATLSELLPSPLFDERVFARDRTIEMAAPPYARSLSLWHPLPVQRDCDSGDWQHAVFVMFSAGKPHALCAAGIEAHWCTCLLWEVLDVGDSLVHALAERIVAAMNAATEQQRALCSPLSLAAVLSGKRYRPRAAMLAYKKAADVDGFVPDLSNRAQPNIVYYQITLRTTPGTGLFEATVPVPAQHKHMDDVNIDLKTVSRINAHGSESHCLLETAGANMRLDKWCVCSTSAPSNGRR